MFIGHTSITRRFQKQLPDALRSHAFLFLGPEHVGKRMFAEMLARAYVSGRGLLDSDQLQDGSGDVLILKPETVERHGALKQKNILVDDVRRVVGEFALSSRSGGQRALIVDDAHMLSIAAQNALLKTIEEPIGGRIVVVVTHEARSILPTIRSRCERVSFGTISEVEYRKLFIGETETDSQVLYMESAGFPGLAVRLKKDARYAAKVREDMDIFCRLPFLSRMERLQIGQRLSADISSAIDTIHIWIQLARRGVFSNTSSVAVSMRNAERLDQTVRLLRHTNANARLLLENICLVLE